jgi:uncharacterized glyoxalase superfamily protein PhnB
MSPESGTVCAEGRQRVDSPVPSQLNIVVTDMERSVAFYRLLGLELGDVPTEWQPHHRSMTSADGDSGLDLDLDSEAFAAQWGGAQLVSGGRTRVVISFRLPTRDAVDETYERLIETGHRGQQPPYDAFWGARYAIVEDPDGNPIGLMSPATAADRRPQSPPPPTPTAPA